MSIDRSSPTREASVPPHETGSRQGITRSTGSHIGTEGGEHALIVQSPSTLATGSGGHARIQDASHHADAGHLAQLLGLSDGDEHAVAQSALLALPAELRLEIIEYVRVNDFDAFNITGTCRLLRAHLPEGSRTALLLAVVAARTPTGLHSHHLFELIHQNVRDKPLRDMVLDRLQFRLAARGSPGDMDPLEALDGIRRILLDNPTRPPEHHVDLSQLEMIYVTQKLEGMLERTIRPIRGLLAGVPYHRMPATFLVHRDVRTSNDHRLAPIPVGGPLQLGPAAYHVLERVIMGDNETRDELLGDEDDKRADVFSDYYHIETPQGRERVEMIVCDPTMPAGEAAYKRVAPPDAIADEYGVRPDEQDGTPNRARQLLRDMHARGTAIYPRDD